MSSQLQSTAHPPLQPTYILRGHTAQIHAVHFLRQNLRLLTGDADGWVVLWNLPIRRPIAVWRPHGATVLGLGSWGRAGERVITHGRDGRLCIWQLREGDEMGMSKVLPVEDAGAERKTPWLLHSLVVSAVNFCSFTLLVSPSASAGGGDDEEDREILIATPGVQDGSVNVTSFPSESRVATVPPPRGTNTGMIMAIGLCHDEQKALAVVGGYESGHAAAFRQNATGHWECVYIRHVHSQPVLSLAILSPPTNASQPPHRSASFFTSSADALIARHPLPSSTNAHTTAEPQTIQTRHAGQQSLALRSDALLFATAGWDGRARVYSASSMKELAVLKWHKEGCYAVAFAEMVEHAGGRTKEEEGEIEVVKRELSVAEKRVERTRATHWVAVGAKDGKLSLWEVY